MRLRTSPAILHGPAGIAQPWGRRLLAAAAAAFVFWPGGAALAQSPCSGFAPGADRPVRNLAYQAPTSDLPRSVHLLDLWPGAAPLPAPLVVFVHGGTWMHGGKYAGTPGQARAFRKAGYAYATVNYRLLRHGPPQEAARDIAEAVAFLRREAKGCGLDPDRIVLMGHSAGAHLAALVALDESYLEGAGVPPEAVRAVVLLDAYGLDIALHVRETGDRVYARVFGPDPAGWTAMSPVTHAASGRPPPPVLMHVDGDNSETPGQAQALAEAVRAAGGEAQIHEARGESHNSLNYGFGAEGDETTRLTLDFLAARVR
ncbi:MAG: alpha/beta hydrolase [Phenylobacterium sp.]|uniref:alpha/beta hydrolase n=1 Tax=Phenylobacterium sp. TaxID=1871053 RepID=UPI0025DDD0CC|nr:alpha/beta hydrolase [Phenylobacterium sp.]MCA3710154.1 alpha/beta hydrolase [Phenylobacterium sp.]